MCIEPSQQRLLARIGEQASDEALPEVADWNQRSIVGDPADSAPAVLYCWPGRSRHLDEDLQYHRARHYDPTVGRWLSADGLGYEAADEDKYRYVT